MKWTCIVLLNLLMLSTGGTDGLAAADSSKASGLLSPAASPAEIRALRIFSEPLMPVGHRSSAVENERLARAIATFQQRTASDDFAALERFLADDPKSAWAPALWFNLAAEYYNSGWYARALAGWERSWAALENATEPEVKPLADQAAGELAYMYARLGRAAELEALLKSVEGRAFTGPATEKISGARQGLWTMRHQPEIAFRCGPLALGQILLQQKAGSAALQLVHEAQSSTNGCSLSQVAGLSRRVNLNYQMAYRSNGAALLLPAVVNWKAGHYAALLREEGGLYLLQDPTFGNDSWLSRRALEAETSGYFLVREGGLPSGWRAVSEAEGRSVFGKGTTSTSDPDSTTEEDPKADCDEPMSYAGIRGMAKASSHLMVVSLNIQDIPVGYAPPVGPPVFFLTTYNQREANQPAIFGYSNLGPKWSFNWLSCIKDNPATLSADVDYFTEAGGALPFSSFNTTNQTFAPQVKNQSILKRTSSTSYELTFRTGAKIIFALPHGAGSARRVLMTQRIDPQGNAVNIGYDGSFRIVGVTNAIGQVTTFSYDNPSDTLKITKVTDPFGRFATFNYDLSGRLTSITDVIGLTSQFTYDAGDFIRELITPYGTNSFEKGESGRQRWLITTHPNGERERVEYNEYYSVTGIPVSDPAATLPAGMSVVNNYLGYRNSFHWDRKAYAEAPADYSKARLYHWVHMGNNAGGILESERQPFENRVWYTYDGQPLAYSYGTTDQPNAIGRVLDDGSTQLTRFSYDSAGNLTNSIDPAGRSTAFIYDTNRVDLLEIRQTTGGSFNLLSRSIYNTQHLAVAVQNAALQWVTNTFNPRGQLLTTRNAKGETTTFTYDANGYLLNLDGPLPGTNDSLRFSYDAAGRVRSFVDPENYALTNSYDNLDRLTNVTFPDGTFTAFTYDKLDRVKARDRQGRETQFTYDSLRRLTSTKDPLNRIVRLEYCDCDGISALIDSLGRATRWEYDLQGRMTAKQYPDGSRILFNYENTLSRLKSVRDEKGQIKNFEYLTDNSLRRISYPIAQVPTPSVNFSYDSSTGQLRSRQDGVGTTTWTYHPAGSLGAFQIAAVDGPWANDTITYQYDALGRITNRAINGVAQSLTFDALGRASGVDNPLGHFGYTYDGLTARLLDVAYPNGQTTHYDYAGTAGDHRLQRITHRRADNSVISRFDYARNLFGNITNWVQEIGSVTNVWGIGYDSGDQLLNVAATQGGGNFNYSYTYDSAGNRLGESVAATNRTFQYNALNQLVSLSDSAVTNATYEWDGENRLNAINAGMRRTEFGYDGNGRRCRILERTNGVVESERLYLWVGSQLCEERDSAGNVLQRFFEQGFTRGGTNYFYTRDHLQSVREVSDVTGQVQARYAYDPFGQSGALQENVKAPFGYTGHFVHGPSGLNLTLLRPYNSRLGRWLARDPLAETQGANLYAYVGNDPINQFDPFGACANGKPPSREETDQLLKDLSSVTKGLSDLVDTFGKLTDYLGYIDNMIGFNDMMGGAAGAADKFWSGLSRQETLGNVTGAIGDVLSGADLAWKSLQAVNDPTLANLLQAGNSLIHLHPVAGATLDYGMALGGATVNQFAMFADLIGGPGTTDQFLLNLGDTWLIRSAGELQDSATTILNTPYW